MLYFSINLNGLNYNTKLCFRYADKVSIGDEILVHETNLITQGRVINMSSITMQGNHLSRMNNNALFPVCIFKNSIILYFVTGHT